MNPNPKSRAFGRALRRMRHSMALTQVEFSEEAGLDQAHLSKLETGQRLPRNETLTKLARTLGPSKMRRLLYHVERAQRARRAA